jgi:DNA replication protein DnaC
LAGSHCKKIVADCEGGPIIVTTQYPANKWHSLFDDPTTSDAICDRLIPTAIKLNLKGKSLRGNNKKRKEKSCAK